MQITLLSDTHQSALPKAKLAGDVLIHCGDFYNASDQSDRDLVQLNRWFADQDFKLKIFVPGNHDYPVFKSWYIGDGKLTEAKLLVDESLSFDGLKIYGSPWVPNCGMAFNCYAEDIASKWAAIPDDTDILVTHMPPRHILDADPRGGNLGCPLLQERVFEIKPKLHAFGHVHASYGSAKIEGITLVNASQCYVDEKRRPIIVSI